MKIGNAAGACALAVLALATAARAQDTYTIDPVHTSIAFKVKHMMVSDVKGQFERFSGTIVLDPKNVEASSVDVTIETPSISTNNEKRDGHLKSPDFFDAEKFPTITFKSKKVMKKGEQWVAVGDFTMRGVTKEIELPFTLSGPVSAGTASVIGVSAATEINRQDYGVSWNKTLDAGGAVVSDKVRIELEVEAKKQAS
ncbi:MAG TPA: YceI family protein [Candidatus Krumholzibacteria bacterium]|nr:YceI family protein [Candidatus Krumholzibacteria bacterium]